MTNIKVMVIDDSAIVRRVLSDIVNATEGMEVIEVAMDPIFALQKLLRIKPDVITLDIEMPRMDGLTFLQQLMEENPIPVVMCSSLTQKSAEASLKALRFGAVEIVAKPLVDMKQNLIKQKKELVDAIRAAAGSTVKKINAKVELASVAKELFQKNTADVILPKIRPTSHLCSDRFITIGASTGGTRALEYLLSQVDADCPGMLVVQHMPESFTKAFADRLDTISKMRVKEAETGDLVERGQVLVAQGGKHLLLENRAGKLTAVVKAGPLVSRHCPSVDVLFRSAALIAPRQTLGVILTGMGADGAVGMREMHDHGAFTIAQNEESCVIFGMPKEAIAKGGVKVVCPLEGMPEILNCFGQAKEFEAWIKSNN